VWKESSSFSLPSRAHAHSGEIATAAEVKLAFETRISHEVEESTIDRLLDRHGWRKLLPRPQHPKGSQEEQDHLKKTDAAPRSGGSRDTGSPR
jgi:hypothetical protein